jgi:hypothetical protein
MPSKQVTLQGVITWDDASQPGFPTHPIAPGGPPPGFWGGVAPPLPTHPIAPGGLPPGFWGGVAPPVATHPIAPGGPPPGYWGGVAPPHPDQGLPGVPPGYWGGVAPPHPDQGLPGQPPGYWGGVAPPHPTQPISGGGYIIGWSPAYGPVLIPLGGASATPPSTGAPHPPGEPAHPIAGPPQPEPKK